MAPTTRSASRRLLSDISNLDTNNGRGRSDTSSGSLKSNGNRDKKHKQASFKSTTEHEAYPSLGVLPEQPWQESKFEILEELGSGAQSRVFRARHTPSEQIYAVKMIDYNCNRDYADRELKIHQSLDFPGVVQLHGHYFVSKSSRRFLCLVLEYCPKTMLDQTREACEGRIPEARAAKYIHDITQTLLYLHGKKIIHRDIKLANLLISAEGKVKLADFGISTRNRPSRKTIIGTKGCMAPEIEDNTAASKAAEEYLKRTKESGGEICVDIPVGVDLYDSQYDEKVDLYSLGATLYAMLSGKLPGEESENGSDLDFDFGCESESVFDIDYAMEIMSADALDLVLGLLEECPEVRMTLQDVLDHCWMQSFE